MRTGQRDGELEQFPGRTVSGGWVYNKQKQNKKKWWARIKKMLRVRTELTSTFGSTLGGGYIPKPDVVCVTHLLVPQSFRAKVSDRTAQTGEPRCDVCGGEQVLPVAQGLQIGGVMANCDGNQNMRGTHGLTCTLEYSWRPRIGPGQADDPWSTQGGGWCSRPNPPTHFAPSQGSNVAASHMESGG